MGTRASLHREVLQGLVPRIVILSRSEESLGATGRFFAAAQNDRAAMGDHDRPINRRCANTLGAYGWLLIFLHVIVQSHVRVVEGDG